MRILVTALPLLWAAILVRGASAAEPKVFDVREYGAKGDGRTVDTVAIQKALDACGRQGGGIVKFPAGTYLSQPLFLRSQTTIELEAGAKLLGTPSRRDYLKPGQPQFPDSSAAFFALVNGKDLTNVVIRGKGTIDGAGAAWWDAARQAKLTNKTNTGYTLPRPRLVLLERCRNVRVEGITLANSPSFHLVPKECEDVLIEGLTITAPDEAPNTDGIDPSISRRVRIAHCYIDVGDDNIAIKAGRRIPGREFACEDIWITHCTLRHGHGISIGSETLGGVRNVVVRNCTFTGTENGIRIKSARGRGGRVEDIVYEDIRMTNVNPAITLTAYYPKIPASDAAQPVSPATPAYRNIRITNLQATCVKGAGVLVGLPESPLAAVLLHNVRIHARTGLLIRNATGVKLDQVTVTTATGPPFLVENAEVEGWQPAGR